MGLAYESDPWNVAREEFRKKRMRKRKKDSSKIEKQVVTD